MQVRIGRCTGPRLDVEVESTFDPDQLETIKDVLMMVNKASNHKEGWYCQIDDGVFIIPFQE